MSKKILVVDDEKGLTELLKERLEGKGYSVEECWDGKSALEKLTHNPYHLVILDYALPGIKGDELLKKIRSNSKTEDLTVLVMTAYRSRDADYFLDQGATDVIYKPTHDKDLMEKVRFYLN